MVVPTPRKLTSGNWFIQLRLGGESIPVTERTEKECVASARLIKAEYLAGKREGPNSREEITVGKAIDDYISERANILSPCTIRSYRHIRKYRFSNIMGSCVSDLTKSDIQKEINRESENIGYKTIKNALALLRSACGERLTCDLSRLTMPAKKPRAIPVYDAAQLKALFEAVKGDPIEPAVYLAAWLGLRRSEILGLKYEDFDRDVGAVAIHAARVPDELNRLVEKGTKTIKSTRILSCPSVIMDVIGEGKGFLYSEHKQNYILARLQRICELAELPIMTLHGLRHTNASIMLALNIPDKYAMERGGWSSNNTMKTIYQHTLDTHRIAADSAVDNYFGKLVLSDNANDNANDSE